LFSMNFGVPPQRLQGRSSTTTNTTSQIGRVHTKSEITVGQRDHGSRLAGYKTKNTGDGPGPQSRL
jgi:hypothetical protein